MEYINKIFLFLSYTFSAILGFIIGYLFSILIVGGFTSLSISSDSLVSEIIETFFSVLFSVAMPIIFAGLMVKLAIKFRKYKTWHIINIILALIILLYTMILYDQTNISPDASAMASMSAMRAEAELVVDAEGNYPSNLCKVGLADLISAVESQNKNKVDCRVQSDAWGAMVKFKNDKIFCVDSMGFAGFSSLSNFRCLNKELFEQEVVKVGDNGNYQIIHDSLSTLDQENETKDWKVYTNTKYGYSVKFPTDFNAVVSGSVGESAANSDSSAIIVTNNKLALTINPNALSSGESEIKGITVDKGLKELAQSAENRYNNLPSGSVEFINFSYLKKSYPFAELAGYMEGIIENTKDSENYSNYSETYRLQTKHNGRFFEVIYNNRVPKAEKDSAAFKAGFDKLEKIISTIKFTK